MGFVSLSITANPRIGRPAKAGLLLFVLIILLSLTPLSARADSVGPVSLLQAASGTGALASSPTLVGSLLLFVCGSSVTGSSVTVSSTAGPSWTLLGQTGTGPSTAYFYAVGNGAAISGLTCNSQTHALLQEWRGLITSSGYGNASAGNFQTGSTQWRYETTGGGNFCDVYFAGFDSPTTPAAANYRYNYGFDTVPLTYATGSYLFTAAADASGNSGGASVTLRAYYNSNPTPTSSWRSYASCWMLYSTTPSPSPSPTTSTVALSAAQINDIRIGIEGEFLIAGLLVGLVGMAIFLAIFIRGMRS